MKLPRLLVIAFASLVVVVVVALGVSAYWVHKQTPFGNTPKLISALQSFSRDQASAGRQLPPEVSLQELVRGGYLTTNDVQAFRGMDVAFSIQADDTDPQMILARASTPDGQFICLLADGSVQQLNRSRYEELRTSLGRPDGPANRSQPGAPDTNRTPAAPGSVR